ncbi:DUF72 domain-containing protein [Gluconacetobacter entanii]|uniref:DUF72 domain-containing protein n=1 Tax=Gluconacetobacter entanii TaxID=108528 RepID=UPI001C934B63|nr:DUF72 domain-containing protein [Gluconacetobacter entanii]MBY4640144.1 DUF72 domain-containing protein [Gluconacetobacter entanii]MCW4580468.1 DUF72 domain-containing protein [Gluconacetobacter entanii]MCW4583798.1 DUF72 domain-containing protein [Gluconacetobacter entanii]MCW4587143.1 DUF72 domain-containing protein [Gluconacetobacter entanii]
MSIRIGVAGWSIPAALAGEFPSTGTHLERYAGRLLAVEINSSFYRPHRRTTYERWAAGVPSGFRFSVKLPRAITHDRRLVGCGALMEQFAEETEGLGAKRGPILVQLPPGFAYPGEVAERFFTDLKAIIAGPVVLEPRHASWFQPEVERMLQRQQVSRVAADPARPLLSAAHPGGWDGLAYFRLHGSPRIYVSPYGNDAIVAQAGRIAALKARGTEVWTIFDNTTYGAATRNALELVEAVMGNK